MCRRGATGWPRKLVIYAAVEGSWVCVARTACKHFTPAHSCLELPSGLLLLRFNRRRLQQREHHIHGHNLGGDRDARRGVTPHASAESSGNTLQNSASVRAVPHTPPGWCQQPEPPTCVSPPALAPPQGRPGCAALRRVVVSWRVRVRLARRTCPLSTRPSHAAHQGRRAPGLAEAGCRARRRRPRSGRVSNRRGW